jgi:hypothetical protein
MAAGIPEGKPVVLTHRQWVILQQAVLALRHAIAAQQLQRQGEDGSLWAWEDADGPTPTGDEFGELYRAVHGMQRQGKPGTPKTVVCHACQDRPGFDGLGRRCKTCEGKGVRVDGVW